MAPNGFRRGLVIPSEASRSSSHRSPGGVDLRGLISCPAIRGRSATVAIGPPGASRPTRPILRAMRRLIAFVVLATLLASCGGTTGAGPDRPVRILSGEPTTLDPAAQGDAGSAAITAQLFESLTDLRRRPPGPPRAGRIVAVRRRWSAGHVPAPTEPDLLRRQPAPAVGRRPQLAAPDRPEAAVAAGVAGLRHQGRRGVPARPDRPTPRRSGSTPMTRRGR